MSVGQAAIAALLLIITALALLWSEIDHDV